MLTLKELKKVVKVAGMTKRVPSEKALEKEEIVVKEILERAGVTYHSKNIQTYIMALVEAGYLEMTNPEHPNASNQKYRRSKK
jgi:hypothetical protein